MMDDRMTGVIVMNRIITKPHVWLCNDIVSNSRMTSNDWYVYVMGI